jgi:hypothetical protein
LQGPERERTDALLDAQIREHGWPAVMSIVEGGQHAHPDGLFYGGPAPSWSNRTLHQIIQKHVAHADVAMCFDLHTGAGEYGHPMLLTITEAPIRRWPMRRRFMVRGSTPCTPVPTP